jgi:hypothetical protein
MKEPLTHQETVLDKEKFSKTVTTLLRMVARSQGSSLVLSASEIVAFTNHLYEYVAGLHAASDVDVEQLTRALLETRGKYVSLQDQAAAIKALL